MGTTRNHGMTIRDGDQGEGEVDEREQDLLQRKTKHATLYLLEQRGGLDEGDSAAFVESVMRANVMLPKMRYSG